MSLGLAPALDAVLSSLSSREDGALAILDLVLASIGDGVAITDASGTSVYFNAAARTILGIAATDPVDVRTHGADLFYLHDFTAIAEDELPLARALRGEETKNLQLFVRSALLPEGAVVCLNARPLRDRDGRVTGGVAVFHDVGARRRAEEELRATNAKLAAWVAELERRATVTHLMNEMADLLQSCRTMTEFYTVVSRFCERIFANEPGAVFVVNPSKSALEIVTTWGGGAADERIFAPTACWALRRGRMHRVGAGSHGPECEHARGFGDAAYTCIPMMGQGEALGVLSVQRNPEDASYDSELAAAVTESRLRAVISVSEHIALALANLRLRETLQMQAIRDPLTGLFNRRYMEESFEREVARAARSGSSVAVIMIDIDHFKKFNDNFGHAAADVALRETTNTLRANLRAEDIPCRFGGEELVIILPDTTLAEGAAQAEALRAAVAAQQISYRSSTLGTVTASFGVAAFPSHGSGPEALLRAADEALYQAKREGRNRVCVKAAASLAAPARRSSSTMNAVGHHGPLASIERHDNA